MINDGKLPRYSCLHDMITDTKAVLNSEIDKNYENMLNWLLGINTLTVFFMLTNYNTIIQSKEVFLVIGIILLMFSIAAILLLRFRTFYLTHQKMLNLPSDEFSDQLGSATIYLKNVTDLIGLILWPIVSTSLGLLSIFIYFLLYISIYALGFFTALVVIFSVILVRNIRRISKEVSLLKESGKHQK